MRRAAALALLGATAGAAQQISPADTAAIAASDKARDAGHYLAAVRVLEPAAFDTAGKPIAGAPFQYWQQFGVMLTAERPAVSPYPPHPLDPADVATLRAARTRDALPEIVRRARATSIVILNESHSDPRNRAFALEVARALRPLGYATLALETLANDPDDAVAAAKMQALRRDGYVRRATGTYTQDPVYADFVRQALALGYRPVAYEAGPDARDMPAREQQQAEQLVRRALPKGATDKLLVYVGLSHATEAPVGDDHRRWMATRLKAMTGIDPLTIDQVSLAADPSESPTQQAHAIVAPRLHGRSGVLMRDGAPLVWGIYAGAIDLQVVHPDERLRDGRPDWLWAMGRAPRPIPAALLPTRGERLVQAFLADEATDAVPVDQVLVAAGARQPVLLLPPGRPVRYATEDDPGGRPLHVGRR